MLDALSGILVCALLAAMAWQFFVYAQKMARAHETTFVLQLQVAPFWYGVDAILWIAFFLQAEDGIRDGRVTGVQTCALPISLFPGHNLQQFAGLGESWVGARSGR